MNDVRKNGASWSRGNGVSTWIATAALVLGPGAAAAQEPAGTGAAAAALRVSPYRASLPLEAALLGLGVAGTMAAERAGTRTDLTREVADRLTPAAVVWFDRSAASRWAPDLVPTSERVASTLAWAPLALLADGAVRRDWLPFALMYVQTTLLAGATSDLSKETIHRYRPYVYNERLTWEEKTEPRDPGKAFFSSAATYAFARAAFLSTVFSDYHPDSPLKPFVWGASLATAGAVGWLRYASGLHYPSDVLVGAAVGAAIGWGVPRLHRMTREELEITPLASGDRVGLALRLSF